MKLRATPPLLALISTAVIAYAGEQAVTNAELNNASHMRLNHIGFSSLADEESTFFSAGNLQVLASNELMPKNVADIQLIVTGIDLHAQAGAYVSLSTRKQILDLAELNASVEALAQATVPEGVYDDLRVTIASIEVTYADGSTLDYDFPTAVGDLNENQFVAQFSPAISVASKNVTHLLLDFGSVAKNHWLNLAQATRVDAHSELLPPFQVLDLDLTGFLGGVVTSDESGVGGAQVFAEMNGEVVGVTRADVNGNYFILGLPPGSYQLFAAAKGYQPTQNIGAAVLAQSLATLNIDLTKAQDADETLSEFKTPSWTGGDNFDHP